MGWMQIGDMSGWVGIAKLFCEKLRAAAGVIDKSHGSGTGEGGRVRGGFFQGPPKSYHTL